MSLLFLTHDVVMVRDDSSTFGGRLFVNRLQDRVCQDCCLYVAVSFLHIVVSVCRVLGLTIYGLTSFLPCPAPLLQSKSTSVLVHHILRLSASAQEN